MSLETINILKLIEHFRFILLILIIILTLIIIVKIIHNISVNKEDNIYDYKLPIPWKMVIYTLFLLSSFIFLRLYIEDKLRGDFLTFISTNEHKITIKINNKQIGKESQNDILKSLQTIQMSLNHHSGPTGEFTVLLKTNEQSIELLLKQDSKNFNEYWVYYPEFTTFYEIGRIQTSKLNSYVKRFQKGGRIWYYKTPNNAIEYIRKKGYPTKEEILIHLEKENKN